MGSTRVVLKNLMMDKLNHPGPPKCEGICYVFLLAKYEARINTISRLSTSRWVNEDASWSN